MAPEIPKYTAIVSMDTDSHPHEPDIFSMKQSDGRITGFPTSQGSVPIGSIQTGQIYTFSQTKPGLLPVINPPPDKQILFEEGMLPTSLTGKLVAFHNPGISTGTGDEEDAVLIAELALALSLSAFFPFALDGFTVALPEA